MAQSIGDLCRKFGADPEKCELSESLNFSLLHLRLAILTLEDSIKRGPFSCTRCGTLANILERGPRSGKPWYGDHNECRRAARQETLRRSDQRRKSEIPSDNEY